MAFSTSKKLYSKFQALPTKKKVWYTSLFIIIHAIGIAMAIGSHKLSKNLEPLAQKMQAFPESWLILSLLIIIVSIPPLFGHELLALIAGYVYGTSIGFLILTASSIIGESLVYFAFRYWFLSGLERFRKKHEKNYGVFVAVVDDGGILMLWFIRMSVIPPHFSTPLFSSLRTITWWKWMVANVLASPVKFFPPVFIGALLRSKNNNSILGDVMFGVSAVVTVGVLFYIRRAYMAKKTEEKSRLADEGAAMGVVGDGDENEYKIAEAEYASRTPGGTEYEMKPMGKAHMEDGRTWV